MSCFSWNNQNIFYELVGQGEPLLLLHANTASSAMFAPVVDLYSDRYQLILMDFLGHGKSDRLSEFPMEFWFYAARQAMALLDELQIGPVHVIGTSGGALVALNVALERPDLVLRVVADSFEGEHSLDAVVGLWGAERRSGCATPEMKDFWYTCHGNDYEAIVANDIRAMLAHHRHVGSFFHKDLSELQVPVLLTASMTDALAPMVYFHDIYAGLLEKIPVGQIHLFPNGAHPAMISNAKEFAALAKHFLTE